MIAFKSSEFMNNLQVNVKLFYSNSNNNKIANLSSNKLIWIHNRTYKIKFNKLIIIYNKRYYYKNNILITVGFFIKKIKKKDKI